MGNVTRKSAYKGIELKCRDSDRVKTFCDAAIDSSIKLELRWTKWDRENLLHETLHEFEKKCIRRVPSIFNRSANASLRPAMR